MIDMLKKNWLSFLLYFLLGVVLDVAGVGIVTQPIEFLGILLLVIAIDMNSHFNVIGVYNNSSN